ncbi:hypothetical protein ABZW03_24795 [Kitasatospora sp. NPDC004799]|uniref:hypothetical protein n=1 Tax=Kitasatospora sp. NPDC004799 TaxID=3154460 RepID=UPI0033B4C40B
MEQSTARQISKRGRRTRLAAVAAVAVLGSGFAINAWLNRAPEPKVHEGPVPAQLLVSADGQTLTLNIGWSCEKKPELVAHETADSVKVSLRHTAAPGFCDPGGIGRITTHLTKPLGPRTLYDTVAGRPAVHFDERDLLRPTYLPENYYPYPAARMVELPGLDPLPSDIPAWASGYQLGTDPQSGWSLIISQALRSGPLPVGQVAGVNKHPASITQTNPSLGPRSLTWSDGTYTFSITTGGPTLLSAEELIRVAESLK